VIAAIVIIAVVAFLAGVYYMHVKQGGEP